MKNPEKFNNIYMEQTNSKNPFGPNYFGLSTQKKIAFKFSKMKAFIKPSNEDLVKKEDEELKFIGSLLLSISGAAFVGGALRMLIKRASPKFFLEFDKLESIYYPALMVSSFIYTYSMAEERYHQKVQKYFLNKYLPQAIQNGFVDYEISK